MKLTAEDCVCIGDYLYFISMECNMIFRLCISSGVIEIVDCLPEEYFDTERLGSKILSWQNHLIFAPMNGKKIWQYDLLKKTWKGYDIKKLIGLNNLCKMFQAVEYNNGFVFIGCNYPALTVLNPDSGEIFYIEKPYEEYKDLEIIENDVFFRTDCVLKGEMLYVASCLTNTVLKFNLATYEYKYIRIGSDDMRFSGIDYDGEFFYLAPRKKGALIQWDGHEKITEINLPYINKDEMMTFVNVVCKGNEIVLAMSAATKDEQSMVIDKTIIGGKDAIKTIDKRYYFYRKIGKDFYVSLDDKKELQIIKENKVFSYKMEIDDYIISRFIKEKKQDPFWMGFNTEKEIHVENEAIGLNVFLATM